MSEPRLDDDFALGIEPVCDNCERQHDDDCDNGEPDVMWDDFFEDQEITMDKELIKHFYTLRSSMVLLLSVRNDTDSIAPFTSEEYTAIMTAYHSIQEATSSIYKREVEFFGNQVS